MARLAMHPKDKRNAIIIVSSIVAVGLAVFAAPTVITLICGMLPTLVAFIVDRERERYATFCVASMNFCGVFPYVLDLWLNDHTIAAAVKNLTDVFALVVIFGAAGFGWVIYSTIPSVISSFLLVIAQRRVGALRTDQRKLIEEWGEAVAEQVEGAVEKLKASAARAQQVSSTNAAGSSAKPPGPPSAPGAPAQN